MSDQPYFFTWTAQNRAVPVAMTTATGVFFETEDGARWLDLGSMIYQANLGHGRRDVIDAICDQAQRLCVAFPRAAFPEKTEVAERLLALAPPGFSKVFFTLGGSDANENALKIARLFTGRYKLISRYRAYHGATMGAITLSGDYRRPPVEPGLVGVVHVLDSECGQCPRGLRSQTCDHDPLTRIPAIIEHEGPATVAAVFAEPIPGANGVLIPPPGYFARIREACDRHGVLLVVDEVLTGFGRTGKCFGIEHFDGVVPDMITVGKALTAGYGALGAVLVHERIAKFFDEETLYAGLTHYAHPLGIASALAALRAYDREGLFARAARLEAPLRAGLAAIAAATPTAVVESRVAGLLSATQLDLDSAGWQRLRAELHARHVHAHVQERSQALILAPPLIIDEEDLARGISLVGEAIASAAKPA